MLITYLYQAVYRWQQLTIKEALDKGFRPLDLKLSVEGILHETGTKSDIDILDEVKLDKLNLKEEYAQCSHLTESAESAVRLKHLFDIGQVTV